MKNAIKQIISEMIKQISFWLVSTVFIWWGWNVFAWQFNLPQFNYLEVFAMRMALSYIIAIFCKNIKKSIAHKEKMCYTFFA